MIENNEKPKAEVSLIFEKATKNTWRFEEIIQPGIAPVLNHLYVQKSTFKRQPNKIKVTIEIME
ncbi:MAG: hypothetical protein ACTSP3_00245 [Candidatus Heimdallarchaeaceae archaeon]